MESYHRVQTIVSTLMQGIQHTELIHRQTDVQHVGGLRLVDQGVGVGDFGVLLGAALFGLGEECLETSTVQMRYRTRITTSAPGWRRCQAVIKASESWLDGPWLEKIAHEISL